MLSLTPLHFERETSMTNVPEGAPYYGRHRYLTDCRRFSLTKYGHGHDTHWRIAKALRYFDAARSIHEYNVWEAWLTHVGLTRPTAWPTRAEALAALTVCLTDDQIAIEVEAGGAHHYQPSAFGLHHV